MVSYWIQGATLAALMVITALAARDSKGSHSFHRTVWFPEGEFKKRGQKLPSSEEYDYDLDQQVGGLHATKCERTHTILTDKNYTLIK